jgi:very-short-patch-repair endonuclease
MGPVRRQISPHAARLRRDSTDVERAMWARLRNRQLTGAKFRRQASLGPYVVDFLCIETKLIVELDGGQHSAEADAPRTAWLSGQGYRILRFWNNDVAENVEGVLAVIADVLEGEGKKTLTQPSPAKAGEG